MHTSRFRLYGVPFIIGSACGLGIFFALQESGVLFTNIGGVPVTSDISQSDVVISEDAEGNIIFTAMKTIPDIESISLILTYDPSQVTLSETDITSNSLLNVTRANEGQLIITAQEVGTLMPKEIILTIHPTGPSEQLTLSDVIAHFATESTPLIVTSLN